MSRRLEVFEHQKLQVPADGEGLRPADLEALVRFNDEHGGRYFDVGHRYVRAKSFVGYVEVGDLSIEILPKADAGEATTKPTWREGLLEMLRVALGMRVALHDANQGLGRIGLLDLVARAFLMELRELLHGGLAKGYRSAVENGRVFRGRLMVAEHIRANVVHAERFFVDYRTFDHEILVNQLLATALDALSWCALSPAIASAVEAMCGDFPAVRRLAVTDRAFERLQLGRATTRYEAALRYARMILGARGPDLRAGGERVFALLFDMNVLWERYVAAMLRRASPPGIRIATQERHPFWAPPHGQPSRVRPDIVVRDGSRGADGPAMLVIDTKWKVPVGGVPSDADLKQMFVYNEVLSTTRAVLLYPRTREARDLRGVFAKKPHGCEQVHLGLFEEGRWSSSVIERELRALVSFESDRPSPVRDVVGRSVSEIG